MGKLSQGIKKFDLFGEPVKMSLKGKKEYHTFFGGMLSIFIMFGLCFLLVTKLNIFFKKEDIKVTKIRSISSDPLDLKLSKNNFMFAVSIEQKNYLENPFFQIELQQRLYTRDNKGNLEKQKLQIQLEPCTLEHWINFDSSDQEEMKQYWEGKYNQIQLQNWLCPNLDEIFSLQGFYSSQNFDFMRFKIIRCQENNELYPKWKNYKCASDQELLDYQNNRGEFKLQIYTSNVQLNPQSTENIETRYLFSDLHFGFVPQIKYKKVDIFLESTVVSTNQGIYFQESIEQKEYPVIQLPELREDTNANVDEKEGLGVFYMRRSSATNKIKREFMSFNDLISYFGGLLEVIFSVAGMVTVYFNKKYQDLSIAKRIYNFSNDTHEKQKEILDKFNKNEMSGTLVSQQIKKTNDQKNKSIHLNFKYFCYCLFGKKCFKNKTFEIIDQSSEQVGKEMDVIKILNKLDELDRLKSLLLNQNQQILFKNTPQPYFQTVINSKKIIPENEQHIKTKKDAVNLFQAYDTILKQQQQQQQSLFQQNMNKNLVQNMGEDFYQIFQVYKDKFIEKEVQKEKGGRRSRYLNRKTTNPNENSNIVKSNIVSEFDQLDELNLDISLHAVNPNHKIQVTQGQNDNENNNLYSDNKFIQVIGNDDDIEDQTGKHRNHNQKTARSFAIDIQSP